MDIKGFFRFEIVINRPLEYEMVYPPVTPFPIQASERGSTSVVRI